MNPAEPTTCGSTALPAQSLNGAPAVAPASVDQPLIDALLDSLQHTGGEALAAADEQQLLALLAGHGLLGPEGIQACVDEATLPALLRAVAAWHPAAGQLLTTDIISQRLNLPAGHTLAWCAWPERDGGWWLARPGRQQDTRHWCWWQQDALIAAPVSAFTSRGPTLLACEQAAAALLRPAEPASRKAANQLLAALHDGIAQAALDATDSHISTRIMFHRPMTSIPAIAWRMQQARQLLQSRQYRPLRIELEQLQGGQGFMQESWGSLCLDWLFSANLASTTATL